MTNADVIRSMTDEQLYEFLPCWELQDIDYAVTFCDLCEQGKREGGKGKWFSTLRTSGIAGIVVLIWE